FRGTEGARKFPRRTTTIPALQGKVDQSPEVISGPGSRLRRRQLGSRACDPFLRSRSVDIPWRRPMNVPAPTVTPTPERAGGIDFITMTFLILTPIIGVVGTALYTYLHGFHLWMPIFAMAMYGAVGMSICAG